MQELRVEEVYRQSMAPESAGPQPPSGRSDTTGGREPGPEAYGPLTMERQIKQDGRALILYARLESPDQMSPEQ